jgi:hypothetical protein
MIDGISAIASETQHKVNTTFVAGKEYVAEVISCSKDQVVTMRVANMVMEGNFKRPFLPGQTLLLKCVSAQALPLFKLAQAGLQAALLEDVVFSKTGALIEAYLKNVESIPEDIRLVAIKSTLINSPLESTLIARELERSVVLSGLFYESHLASYSLGRKALEQLMFEPQNQPGFNASEMVVKQLNIFEQNSFKWLGAAWQGQIMQWAVNFLPQQSQKQEQDPSTSNTPFPAEPEVSSRLELELPNLKKIVANISWSPEALGIELEVNDAKAQAILNEKLAVLLDAMQASGQLVKSCTIQLHEHG